MDPASITLADLEADPDPILAALRAEQPVAFVPALGMWLVTRWDDVAFVEAHPELFSAATEPSFLARALGPNMLTTDPPEHTRVQSMLRPPFQSGGRSGAFVTSELPALADSLLDALRLGGSDAVPAEGSDGALAVERSDAMPAGGSDGALPLGGSDAMATGRFDVVADYAQPLSAGSLAAVLGLGHHGHDRMWAWCQGVCADIANFGDDPDITAAGATTKAELGEAIAARIAEARRAIAAGEPDESAIARFVEAGATDDEIVNNVRLMISGGINEPADGLGLVTWVLLTRPDLRRLVDSEPARLRRLIEEVFRVISPVGTATRQATRDVEIGGVTIPAGDLVAGVLRSVNLDEAHWSDPTSIDLGRREGSHAAFALGAHRCLGEWLGRQEVRVGVERLLARFPDMELDGDVEIAGFEFRGPRSLVVRTGVSGAR